MSIQAERDHVSIQIDQDLYNLSDQHLHNLLDVSFTPSIFRVYDRLRKENVDAYEPEIVSIGPCHHGKPKLIPTEKHKLRLLKQLLSRRGEVSADRYVKAMRALEERARNCYADPVDHELDSGKFVKMMLLDSCFIIQLFQKIKADCKDEPILQLDHVVSSILRDLKLLENQLPFFVLVEFMKMSRLNINEEEAERGGGEGGGVAERGRGGEGAERGGGGGEDIFDMALRAFQIFGAKYEKPDVSQENIKHLLDLFHRCWCSSFAQIQSNDDLDLDWNCIRPATELKKAGIVFRCSKIRTLSNGKKGFNVRFQNGVMELPHLVIVPNTEVEARNLIAYEQYLPDGAKRYVTDYYILLGHLVYTSKDVEILRRRRIIEHTLDDDGVVSAMINKVVHQTCTSDAFSYNEVLYNVNKHCKRPWNAWIANLKYNYFNTPWAWISFLAAVILLLLTATQTTFGILSYHGGPKS